jgi:hypothetical protein
MYVRTFVIDVRMYHSRFLVRDSESYSKIRTYVSFMSSLSHQKQRYRPVRTAKDRHRRGVFNLTLLRWLLIDIIINLITLIITTFNLISRATAVYIARSPHSYFLRNNMKFSTSTLLLGASAFLTATTDAFVGRQSFGSSFVSTRRSSSLSSSSLKMVADDAKVILVTGSSRGLGKSIALELAKSGQKLVINYVSDGSKGTAEATVEEVKALGGDAIAVQADSTFPYLTLSGFWRCVALTYFLLLSVIETPLSHYILLPARIRSTVFQLCLCLLVRFQLLIQSPLKRCLTKSWKSTARSMS